MKILKFLIITALLLLLIDFIKYPECYLTAWRYQLENDIKSGKPEAIEMYQRNYVDKGRILFD